MRLTKAEAVREFVRGRFALAAMLDGVLAGYEAAFAARSGAPVDPALRQSR
jgi:hypothetical protein